MTLHELLSIVQDPASNRTAFDRDVSFGSFRTFDVVHEANASNEVPSASGREVADTMVYLAVPLSMLRTAAIAADSAPPPPHVSRCCYHFSGWTLAVHEQSLIAPRGEKLHLRNAEYAVLLAFLENPRQVLTRRTLAVRLPRSKRPLPSDRAIDSYVCRLRRHFRKAGTSELIVSVQSVGFRFNSDVLRT